MVEEEFINNLLAMHVLLDQFWSRLQEGAQFLLGSERSVLSPSQQEFFWVLLTFPFYL